MNESDHPDSFDAFIEGRLSEAEESRLIEHLSKCEECSQKVERMWSEEFDQLGGFDSPRMSEEAGERLRQGTMRRIRRSNLGGSIVQFTFKGLFGVVITLLRPFLSVGGRSDNAQGDGEP